MTRAGRKDPCHPEPPSLLQAKRTLIDIRANLHTVVPQGPRSEKGVGDLEVTAMGRTQLSSQRASPTPHFLEMQGLPRGCICFARFCR